MEILPTLKKGTLVVIYAAHAASNEISHVAAQLALRGPLTVLDGGNRFQAYRIAHLLRKHTTEIQAAAERLYIRRAFTCYQMLALLEDTTSLPHPYMVLDLLSTFYDDNVQGREVERLLSACLDQVERLYRSAPVAITLGLPSLDERAYLIDIVCERATTVFAHTAPKMEEQLTLF